MEDRNKAIIFCFLPLSLFFSSSVFSEFITLLLVPLSFALPQYWYLRGKDKVKSSSSFKQFVSSLEIYDWVSLVFLLFLLASIAGYFITSFMHSYVLYSYLYLVGSVFSVLVLIIIIPYISILSFGFNVLKSNISKRNISFRHCLVLSFFVSVIMAFIEFNFSRRWWDGTYSLEKYDFILLYLKDSGTGMFEIFLDEIGLAVFSELFILLVILIVDFLIFFSILVVVSVIVRKIVSKKVEGKFKFKFVTWILIVSIVGMSFGVLVGGDIVVPKEEREIKGFTVSIEEDCKVNITPKQYNPNPESTFTVVGELDKVEVGNKTESELIVSYHHYRKKYILINGSPGDKVVVEGWGRDVPLASMPDKYSPKSKLDSSSRLQDCSS